MMKLMICALTLSGFIAAHAGESPAIERYATLQAGEHIGQTVTVCGVVSDSRYLAESARKPTFLNFDKPFPQHTFTAVIPNESRSKFSEPPETAFKGKRICVTGLVRTSRNKPEIEVLEPSQISVEVVAESPAAPAQPVEEKPVK
jgi:DNA/RNA endonuclease YhcR with UshA esterase domain